MKVYSAINIIGSKYTLSFDPQIQETVLIDMHVVCIPNVTGVDEYSAATLQEQGFGVLNAEPLAQILNELDEGELGHECDSKLTRMYCKYGQSQSLKRKLLSMMTGQNCELFFILLDLLALDYRLKQDLNGLWYALTPNCLFFIIIYYFLTYNLIISNIIPSILTHLCPLF